MTQSMSFCRRSRYAGFGLVEIMVTMGIGTLLLGIVLAAVNPARQFANSRNSQRSSNVRAIFNALNQEAADNSGRINPLITSSARNICNDTDGAGAGVVCAANTVNLRTILVPTYLADLPRDPSGGTNQDTLYQVYVSSSNRVVVTAPTAELGEVIVAGESFSPTQLAGLMLWLKADSITGLSDNQSVASWSDSSANGNTVTQSSPPRQPIYKVNSINGLPTVRFGSQPDGVKDVLLSLSPSLNLSGDFSLFVVLKGTTKTSDDMAVMWGQLAAGRRRALWVSAASGNLGFSGYAANLTTTYPIKDGATHIAAITKDTSNLVSIYGDGQSRVAPTVIAALSNYAGTSGFAIGANNDAAPTEGYTDDIAEVIVYNSVLSTTDRRLVEQYLAAKYGVTLP